MKKDLAHQTGFDILAKLSDHEDNVAPPELIKNWKLRLMEYQLDDRPHEIYIWYSLVLALVSVARGNYGVGSIIVIEEDIVAQGNNKLLKPYLRTDQHAEMNAITEFENKYQDLSDRKNAVLFTTLECCPMCTVRIINSGIRNVYYSAKDPQCGMLGMLDNLPPFWKSMMNKRKPAQQFNQVDCSETLIEYSQELFLSTEALLSEQVAKIGAKSKP